MNTLRNVNLADMDSIMEIVRDAQQSLASRNVNQWQNGYPNRESIERDIENKHGYAIDIDGVIAAYAAIIVNGEPEYDRIVGEWKSERDSDYIVVHRMCVRNGFLRHGLASDMLRHAARIAILQNIHSFKIDTHKDNQYMLDLLQKFGFSYCGEIHYANGDRIAFEKIL